jgi:hypothetical protein
VGTYLASWSGRHAGSALVLDCYRGRYGGSRRLSQSRPSPGLLTFLGRTCPPSVPSTAPCAMSMLPCECELWSPFISHLPAPAHYATTKAGPLVSSPSRGSSRLTSPHSPWFVASLPRRASAWGVTGLSSARAPRGGGGDGEEYAHQDGAQGEPCPPPRRRGRLLSLPPSRNPQAPIRIWFLMIELVLAVRAGDVNGAHRPGRGQQRPG